MSGERIRGSNFKPFEKKVLLKLVASRLEIIENKKTDSASVKSKDMAWIQVTEEFNKHRLPLGWTERTTKQLRNLYDNLKRRQKRLAQEENEPYKVGHHYVEELVEQDESNSQLLLGLDEVGPLNNKYDSDSSFHDVPGPANVPDKDDTIISECSTDKEHSEMIYEHINPIVTIDEQPTQAKEQSSHPEEPSHSEEPSQSHSTWKQTNKPEYRRVRPSEAAKAREDMLVFMNDRRSIMQEELQMLRERHAEEMIILKMRKENEELKKEGLRLQSEFHERNNEHSTENINMKTERQDEDQMLQENKMQILREKHAEEMLLLKMKKENEELRKEALKSKIEFYKRK